MDEGVKFCPACGTPATSAGIEIKQEKAVNYIQAQPAVFPAAGVPQNQFTPTGQTAGAGEPKSGGTRWLFVSTAGQNLWKEYGFAPSAARQPRLPALR
jgi:hypothetical protein